MNFQTSEISASTLGRRGRHELPVAALLAFGFAAAFGLAMRSSSFGLSIAILALYGVVAACLVSREVAKWGHRGLVSPISLFAVFWFAYTALPLPLAVLSSGTIGGAKAEPTWLNLAGLVSLGSLLLVAGGHSIGSRLFVGRNVPAPELTLQLAALMATVGWSSRLYLIATGRYGYLAFGSDLGSGVGQTLLNMGSLLVPLSTAVFGYLAWKTHPSSAFTRILMLCSVVLIAAGGLVSGMKAQVFTDLIPLFIVYIYLRRRLPWRPILLVVIYLALIRLGIEDFRTDIQKGRVEVGAGVSTSAEAVLGHVNQGARSQGVGQQIGELFDHIADEYQSIPDNLALILSRTGRDIPFLGPKRAFLEPIPVIPLSVANDGDFHVSQYVNVVYRGGSRYSSSPAGQPGDLYISAGWPAILVGQVVVGLVLGMLWSFVWLRNDPAITVVYAALSTSFAVPGGTEFGLLLRGLTQRGIGLWVGLGLLAFVARILLSGRWAVSKV